MELIAADENLPKALAFIEERLDEAGCTPKASVQLCLAAEEIFVNIARYAYGGEPGPAKIRLRTEDGTARLTFIDGGVPYDPLAKQDPDVSLSAGEREIGGLGVFLAKQFTDNAEYEYSEGKNVLTLKKSLF